MNNNSFKYYFSIVSALMIMVFGSTQKLNADTYLYSLGTSFSGTVLTGSPPWVTATFNDTGLNQVQLSINTVGLTGTENLDSIFFNFNPAGNVNNLTFSPVAPPGTSIATGVDAFKADGVGGNFDVLFSFPNNTILGGQTLNYNIASTDPLNASMFNFAALDGSGPGSPFYVAAHVQNAQSTSGQSDWIGAGPGEIQTQAPEPATFLVLGGLLGFVAFMKHSRAKKRA